MWERPPLAPKLWVLIFWREIGGVSFAPLSIGANPSTNWLTKKTHVSVGEHNVLRKTLQGPLPILNEDAEVELVKAALDAYGFDFFFAFGDHLQIQQGPGESLAPLDFLQWLLDRNILRYISLCT